jgi:lysophospholipase L1-like esterase
VRALVLAVVACALLSACADDGRDAALRLACVGDSNTSGLPGIPSWCDRLDLGATVHVINVGEPAALAMDEESFPAGAANGMEQITAALAARANVIVIALGGNDALRAPQFNWQPETIAARLRALVAEAEAHGCRVLLATLPPDGWFPDAQPRVEAVNALLRATVAAPQLIDFDTGYDGMFLPDKMHLTAAGQDLRAARVRAAVLR